MTELLGWASSLILLATLIKQVYKQWDEERTEGVSKWLFVGQLAASAGFTADSLLTGNWVFVFTTAALTINNVVGIWIYRRARRKTAAGRQNK